MRELNGALIFFDRCLEFEAVFFDLGVQGRSG